MITPSILEVVQGKIKFVRPMDINVKTYIHNWQLSANVADGTSVCVIRRDDLQHLNEAHNELHALKEAVKTFISKS